MNIGRVAVVAVCLSTARADGPVLPEQYRPPVTRQECTTKITYNQAATGGAFWVFVMNFEVVRNGQPVGCLLVHPDATSIPIQLSLTGCHTVGPVFVIGGKGHFSGGYVDCPANLPSLIGLAPAVTYTMFSIIAMGAVTPTLTSRKEFGNPIGAYRSDDGATQAAMYLPIQTVGVRQSEIVIKSVLSVTPTFFATLPALRQTHVTERLSAAAPSTGDAPQFWAFLYNGADKPCGLTRVCNYVDGYDAPQPAGPSEFDNTELSFHSVGHFYVGRSPVEPLTTPNFAGVIDEVIIDPRDGGGPNTVIEHDPPALWKQSYLPAVAR